MEKYCSENSSVLTFKDTPFSRLITECEKLSELRRQYASSSDAERRLAADFQYHSSVASEMFNRAVGRADDEDVPWPGEVAALAIDPSYAPALLTVGSWEFIYGRADEAITHFLSLTTLPEETEDISDIIDKAGEFLIDNQDYENAIVLYLAACRKYSDNPRYRNGLSYCLAKSGRLHEAIEEARRAVDLDPDNHVYLTDLGWNLVETGYFIEAEAILERAVSLSPPGYELSRGNLEELRRRMKELSNKEPEKSEE